MRTPITLPTLKQLLLPKRSGMRRLAAVAALVCATAASSMAITISGTVRDDGDGGTISGTQISSIQGNPLYVYLINNSNTIVDKSAVSSSTFTYSLTGSASTSYSVALSAISYSIGTSNPILGLPTTYAPTAEGTTSIGDGTPDYSVAINSPNNLTIDFAIDARPTGFSFTLNNPSYDADSNIIIPTGAFTGNDMEDGTYTPGFSGRSVDLFQANGGQLYYNGTLITFTTAATATRISNFDVSLLRFNPNPAALTHSFAFSTIDNAGVPEYVPNTITINLTTPGTSLPIEFSHFEGSTRGNDNQLNWQTATEKGNSHFVVERSEDGVRFRTIATVASLAKGGHSSLPLSYSYTDREANTKGATYYYRIRQVDYDGSFSYSNTVRLSGKANIRMQLAAYPNPSKGTLQLDLATGSSNSETLQLAVVSSTGTTLLTRSIDAPNGRVSTALDLSNYPAGTYYLQLRSATAPLQVQSFVLLPH